MRNGALCPGVIRFKPGGFDPGDVHRRQVCADALSTFEKIAPIVRAMSERA
jgi:hypothetical protein